MTDDEIHKLAGIVSEGIFSHRPHDSIDILIKDIEQSMTQLTSFDATYGSVDVRDIRKILELVVQRLEGMK